MCQMTDFCEKNRLTLGQIISGTKCDRDKQIFSAQGESHVSHVLVLSYYLVNNKICLKQGEDQ